jgi:hypothetical protein
MKKCKSCGNYYEPNTPAEGADEKCNRCYQRDGKQTGVSSPLLRNPQPPNNYSFKELL